MPCEYCSRGAHQGARFCANCGARLQPAASVVETSTAPRPGRALSGELRQLTVMFCDLADSTELSSRLDPEDFGALVGRVQAAIASTVHPYRGRVLKFLGDGALIAFGWPLANDDDAERAVRAGLDLVAAVDAMTDGPPDTDLRLRVGVHTGEAFVGEVGTETNRELSIFGETVNIAARMQRVADPGTVVITDVTLALVRGMFITEDRGLFELRGVPRPVRAHRVVQRSGTKNRFNIGRRSLTSFVGRAEARDSILDICRVSSDAGPLAVLITGEPGMGKSRLLYEVKQALGATAHTWLEGQCSSYTKNTALRPVVDVLEQALSWEPSLDENERRERLGEALHRAQLPSDRSFGVLAELLSIQPAESAAPASADERRRLTYEVLTNWIQALARPQLLIIAVEDLQWADASTLELLTFLIDNCTGCPVAIIATARPEFDSRAFVSGRADVVELEPLDDHAMRALVSSIAGRSLSPPAVEHIADQSSGIPLYAEELALSLSRDGGVEAAAGTGEIPSTLQDLLMARLDRMGAAKRIAQVCAVVGEEFDEALITQIEPDEPELVAESLRQLAQERLLVPAAHGDAGRYTFRHALLREAAYRSLLRRTRREVHARTADALRSRLLAGAPAVAEERVARHYEAAGEPRRAIEMYRAAADQCAAAAAHRERSAHLAAALRLLDQADDDLRCSLLLESGDALWRGGDYEPARLAFQEAAEAAKRTRSPARFAQAALGFAGRMGYGAGAPNPTLIDLLETALQQLSADEPAARAMVTARLAQALTFAEGGDRRFALADEALALARAQDDPALCAAVFTDVHWAIWGPDTLEQRLTLARDGVELAARAADPRLEAEGRMWLLSDLLEAGEVAAAREELDEWAALADQLQDNYQLWAVGVSRAMFVLLSGALDEGERLAMEALSLAREGYNENAFQLFGVQLSNVRREQGRWSELEEPLKGLVAGYAAIPTWRAALAALYAEAGRLGEARDQLDVLAADDFACFRKDVFWLANLMLVSDTSAVLGDADRARLLYRKLEPYPRRMVLAAPFTSCWGSTSRSLAGLAETFGDDVLAEKHFEDAVAHNERVGATAALARTLLEYAEMVGGRSEDRSRAAALARRALLVADGAGLPMRKEQARRLLKRFEG